MRCSAVVALAFGLAPLSHAAPAPVTFSPGMLAFPVDVSLFAAGKPVLPGTYRVDLYLNEAHKGKVDLRFAARQADDPIAQACFTQALVGLLDAKPESLKPDAAARLAAGESICGDIGQILPGASHRFDAGALRLDISAPQRVLLRRARGYVDPARWDAGIPAALLDYRYNGWHSRRAGQSHTSHYLGLRGGVNWGAWRLRYRATLRRRTHAGSHYHGDTLYLERALVGWRSRLTLGDVISDGQVMESLNLRGLVLSSNERMRPDSLAGFAPIIQGVAQSNARVTVHQRGAQIFEMTVPPGPFLIDDLYPNGSGGDLLVTVTEANGTQHRFSVAYTSLPELLRPGATRYSVALGVYRRPDLAQQARLLTANLSHGVNNTVTVYGGVLAAQGYRAVSAGVGLNLPVGALSLDATWARTRIPRRTPQSGTSLRLRYTRLFRPTDTDFSLALARYATPGYLDAGAAFERIDAARRGAFTAGEAARRNQISVQLSQPLPGAWGSVAFSGSVQDYWQRPERDVQYNLSYGRSFGSVSASLTATRSRNTRTGRWDNQLVLTLSLPLGAGARHAYLHTSLAQRPGSQAAQTQVSGTVAEGRRSYSVYASAERARDARRAVAGGASLGWSSAVARMRVSVASSNRGSRQLGLSAAGGMVAFADGLVFSADMGDTVGVVQARHAHGARLRNSTRARLDRHGHALVAHLQPYRENSVELDSAGLSTDVEILNTQLKVAPTEGAVVLLSFPTRSGDAVLATGKRADGSFLPFAAGVLDATGHTVAYVGQRGQTLLRLHAQAGVLTVRWGTHDDEQCHATYDLRAAAARSALGGLRRVTLTCA